MIRQHRPLQLQQRLLQRLGAMTAIAFACGLAGAEARGAAVEPSPPLPVEELSPTLLGTYRKVMSIEPDIVKYAALHGVDVQLAKAVCLYESGGNASLTSSAGAQGYFQVMPGTFRMMRVPTNIEAGIKYLGTLVRQFGREDYALAAYNGGPTRVAAGRAMPLESLQYVIGVGSHRSVLKAYEPSIRAHASRLDVTTVQSGDDWWTLASRLDLPVVQLRLHNPFLAARPLRAGSTIAYPREPRNDLFDRDDGSRYRFRLGDNYVNLAFALNLDLNQLRETNGLWRLQSTLPGTLMTIPAGTGDAFQEYTVRAHDTIPGVAGRLNVEPWGIVRDNQLWDERLTEGVILRIRQPAPVAASRPASRTHQVQRGDTLSSIARRYGTTVRAVQAANGLGQRTLLKTDQRLRIPSR